ARILREEAVEMIVLDRAVLPALDDVARPPATAKKWPRRHMQRQVEIEHDAAHGQARRVDTSFRCEKIERAQLVVAAEHAPCRAGRRVVANRQVRVARNYPPAHVDFVLIFTNTRDQLCGNLARGY